MQKIGVIGAGAWGTALAQSFSKAGNDVTIWAREPEVVKAINEAHENTIFYPGLPLDPAIKATSELNEAAKADLLLVVTPAQHTRSALKSLRTHYAHGNPLVICCKGIEIETGKLMSEIVEEEFPESLYAILTGPNFAAEIGRGLPSAATLATRNKDTAFELQALLSNKNLRPYVTDDIIGAQIGGAIKNVIAIACGAVYGLGLGESARAALVTRGLAEMARLANAMGARKETLMGMCGVGDLLLTCSSMQSRNYSLGVMLGQGKTLEEIMAERNAVTEGVHTAKALMKMAKNHAVEMPVSEAIYRCLNEDVDLKTIIEETLERPFKAENC